MARIRTIKPQHVNDKELATVSMQAHLLWILSWCYSDDDGVFENDPLLIKSQLFPRRTDVRVEQITQWIDQLVKARFVVPFTYNGVGYLIHRTFKTHQKIDKPQPSKIPDDAINKALADSATVRLPFDERSENGRAVLESNVKESKVEESNARNALGGKKEKKEIPVPYASEQFLNVWNTLLKEKNWRNKSDNALLAAAKKLSNYDEATAIQMMLNTIEGEWQGLFPIKNSINGKTNTTLPASSTSISDTLREERHRQRTGT